MIGDCLLHGIRHQLSWDCIEAIVAFRTRFMYRADHVSAADDDEAAQLDIAAYQAAFRAAAENARLGRIA